MKNWKTTVCGILAAVGVYLVNSEVGILNVVGQVLSVVGVALGGTLAKDHDVTGK
jgi:hypothetical protein